MLPHLYSIFLAIAAYVLSVGLLLNTGANAELSPLHRISLVRRDGDFDNLLSELKSKGSRMRFGKRSGPSSLDPEAEYIAAANLYSPDRYLFLQGKK